MAENWFRILAAHISRKNSGACDQFKEMQSGDFFERPFKLLEIPEKKKMDLNDVCKWRIIIVIYVRCDDANQGCHTRAVCTLKMYSNKKTKVVRHDVCVVRNAHNTGVVSNELRFFGLHTFVSVQTAVVEVRSVVFKWCFVRSCCECTFPCVRRDVPFEFD